jgi:hypothetical protein
MKRTLMGAACLLAVGMGAAVAQAPPAPTDAPLAADGSSKTPNNVPEVIEAPGTHADVLHPKETGPAGSVVTPPSVDPQMQVARPPTQSSGQTKKAD